MMRVKINIFNFNFKPIADTLPQSAAQGSNGYVYKPLILVRGSCSYQSKTQIEGRKDKDTCKKGKMALKCERKKDRKKEKKERQYNKRVTNVKKIPMKWKKKCTRNKTKKFKK